MDSSLRSDSSSDESIIPPTPAAKSTPLVPTKSGGVFPKKESLCHQESSSRLRQPISKSSADDNSSDDSSSEDDTTVSQYHLPTVKNERVSPESESSSSEEDNRQNIKPGNIFNSSSQRSVHAMSTSDSDCSEPETSTVNAQLRKQSESSDDSGDDGAQSSGKSFPALITKTERLSNDSSDDSDSSHDSLYQAKNVLRKSSDSEDENEGVDSATVNKPVLGQTAADSSDDESDSVSSDAASKNPSKDIPPRQEKSTVSSNVVNRGDSDSSSDDEQRIKTRQFLKLELQPESSQHQIQGSDVSSDEDNVKPRLPVADHLSRNQSESVSDDESSEDDSSSIKPVMANHAIRSKSSDESSEDESQTTKPSVSALSNQVLHSKSSDESSEDESPNTKPSVSALSNQVLHSKSSDESSEDESPNTKPSVSALSNHVLHSKSSDESSEDESPHTKPSVSALSNQVLHSKSSDESSEDESPTIKPSISSLSNQVSHPKSSDESTEDEKPMINLNQGLHLESSEESSGDEDKSKSRFRKSKSSDSSSSGEESEVKHNTALSDTWQKNDAPSCKTKPAKTGMSLLVETFKEEDALRFESSVLTFEDIENDDEVWLLQCPKSMNIGALKKQQINLAADCDIQVADGPTFKRFSVTPQQNKKSAVNCLLPSKDGNFRISYLPVRGKVLIQEHIHVPKVRVPDAKAKLPVPFPTGLKVRHPLLGAAFEQHLKEAKVALKESAVNSKKKKKDKRKDKSGDEMSRGDLGSLNHSSYSLSPQRNGKKRKHSMNEVDSETTSTDDGYGKKKKKSSSDVQSRVENVTLNESVGRKQKKSKRHSDEESTNNNSSNDSLVKKHKKSKKSEDLQKNTSDKNEIPALSPKLTWHTPQVDEMPVSALYNDSGSEKKKKKGSKKESSRILDVSHIKKEIDDSAFLNGNLGENSLSKKRKRKGESLDGNESTLDDVLHHPVVPAKKKKHSL